MASSSGVRESLDKGCPVVAHTGRLNAVAFSPCGPNLATGGEDREVIPWAARTGTAEHLLLRSSEISSVSFSTTGERLAIGSYDGNICVWDVATALFRTISPTGLDTGSWVQFSPTQNHILATIAHDEHCIHLWDVLTGERIISMQGCDFAMFSPYGRTIATWSSLREVHLFDAESGALRLRLAGQTDGVHSSAFSPDGSQLALCSYDGACRVWDSSTGALVHTFKIYKEASSVAWGRDWVRDTRRGAAFAMGHHPRLGAESQVLELEAGVVRMILDRVYAQQSAPERC